MTLGGRSIGSLVAAVLLGVSGALLGRDIYGGLIADGCGISVLGVVIGSPFECRLAALRWPERELVFDDGGNLPLAYDPKVAWALAHRDTYPVEVTRASYSQLLRVPGVGPIGARRIVEARRTTMLRSLADLRALGVVTTRAAGFLLLHGRRLAGRHRHQHGDATRSVRHQRLLGPVGDEDREASICVGACAFTTATS